MVPQAAVAAAFCVAVLALCANVCTAKAAEADEFTSSLPEDVTQELISILRSHVDVYPISDIYRSDHYILLGKLEVAMKKRFPDNRVFVVQFADAQNAVFKKQAFAVRCQHMVYHRKSRDRFVIVGVGMSFSAFDHSAFHRAADKLIAGPIFSWINNTPGGVLKDFQNMLKDHLDCQTVCFIAVVENTTVFA